MVKSRWKVIMPKMGNINVILFHIRKHIDACLNVVITSKCQIILFRIINSQYILGDELVALESIQHQLQLLKVDNVFLKVQTFRPNRYQTYFAATLPHTLQLDRPVRGGCLGIYEYKAKNVRSPRQNAQDLVCKQVMVNFLGEEKYTQESKKYDSNSSLLFGYSFKNDYARPFILTHTTKEEFPKKCTGIVTSPLIAEPGVVKLNGSQCDTYGSSVLSTMSLLNKIVTQLNIQQFVHNKTPSLTAT
ncbi:hypothetical protein EB796_019943 [Bugula neritina]|uniref:Uncharacterized protein n=1 Tax=Bugula neritina TaxID=10212 RepID=A0A7J7J7W3_BUGNE|nr:hypothetical protein EB796_019943 [Bugula neritina]